MSEKKIEIMDLINPFYIQCLANLQLINIPGLETKLDFENASRVIDLIEFMYSKMKNNLDQDEKKIFEEVLGSLKYQFLEKKNQKEEK